ncbi:MAG: DinB family protein [Mucilaginibacter sp.]|nr:DinB family protein [Mucilaginibacter sp.]
MLYSSLVCRLKTQHLAVAEIVKHIDEQRLNQQPEPGKWSIKDNIAHLVSYQSVFIGRMHQILKGDTPVFSAYRADDEPDFIEARGWSLTDLLSKLNGNRRQILELITNLPDDQLALKGSHPKYGTLTIVEWTEFFLLHEAHHLFTMFKLAKG